MTGATLGGTAATTDLSLADLQAFDPHHKRRDGETDCCCPLCGTGKKVDAAHRSLSYNGQTGAWRCHRCHATGKLRDFWTDTAAKDARPVSRRERDRQRIRRALQLPPAAPPAGSSSSNSSVDTAWKKRIGSLARLPDTPGAAYLESRGLPADFCHAAGVRFAADFFGRPAVVFPLRGGENGGLTAAQGRYIDGRDDPRMRTGGARRLGVFATPGAWDSAALVLVEAPIDALSLALCGVPAVALCGCEGLPDWLKMRCAFRVVIAAFDADDAGDKAARELARVLEGVGCRGKVFRLRPTGAAKDWNAALLSRGADDLRAWLAQELASDALTDAEDGETGEDTAEAFAPVSGQNWAVSSGFESGPLPEAPEQQQARNRQETGKPGTEPDPLIREAYLSAAARMGRLPVCASPPLRLPSERVVSNVNAFVRGSVARWRHAQAQEDREARAYAGATWQDVVAQEAADLDAVAARFAVDPRDFDPDVLANARLCPAGL